VIEADARRILSSYGLEIDVRTELGSYSVAVQQIVAIARAVELSGKVLVLDEPTASLDRNEVQRMFDVVKRLKARGLAIIFITHFLDQVFAISDRVTILRNGRKVGTETLANVTATDVVRMMLGKDLAFEHHPTGIGDGPTGPERVAFRGIGKAGRVAPFTLSLHEGEVVGVAGLLGSGRTEMARLMFGVDQHDGGEVLVSGKPAQIRNPAQAVAAGFGFCPEDRKIDGIFGDLSVRENIVIALQAKLGWFKALNRDEQDEIAGRFAEALDIRAASHDMPVKLLSGGNQQKVILARWLAIDPSFLILDEPTRGIDVGAHAEIVRTINRLREDGLALLVISSELDEVVAYSNRVVVMRDRELVAELSGEDIAPAVIVKAIAENGAVQS
jgi:simple sugar transport system ATP-binding protein